MINQWRDQDDIPIKDRQKRDYLVYSVKLYPHNLVARRTEVIIILEPKNKKPNSEAKVASLCHTDHRPNLQLIVPQSWGVNL